MTSAGLQQALEHQERMLAQMASAAADGNIVAALREAMDSAYRFEVSDAATVKPVSANGVPAEWVTVEESRPGRRMLYLHGGGYIAGSLATHRRLCELLARAAECEVLNLDYRLGPEHLYPAAVEDALIGLEFVQANGADGPGRAEFVVVAGDSAGGGLMLATLLAARDRGLPMPGAGVGLSPWNSLVRAMEGSDPPDRSDPITRAMAQAYIGDADPADPLISPLYADFTGLPPLLLQVGEPEPGRPDTEKVAERARAAGVDATAEIWPEMPHVWHMFALTLPEGQEAIDRLGEFIKRHA